MVFYNYPRKRRASTSAVKRARGKLRSSNSGTSQSQFTIQMTYPLVLSGGTLQLSSGDNVTLGVQALNIYDLLSRSENFMNYKRMYEQVRIDYVVVDLQVTNTTLTTSNMNQMYDIYTAWDRTGLSPDNILAHETNNAITGIYNIMGKQITEYAHSKTTLNAFQRWKKKLYIKTSSLQEKEQFVSTSDIKQWRGSYDVTNQLYPLVPVINDASKNDRDNAFKDLLNSNNPAILTENAKYPWKPTLLIGAFGSVSRT